MVIVDIEFVFSQWCVLEDVVKVKVIDWMIVIFDIFSQYVKSCEGKVQVEFVQFEYLFLCLCGWGELMSWQVGGQVGVGGVGMGLCGFGEMKIEFDW